MTKKEMIARIYEAQREICEAKETIARSGKVLDTLISELNAKEELKDPSFIVDKDGVRWFLAGQAARALGYNSAVRKVFLNCYIRYMRKASYRELKLLGVKAGTNENWLISEVGLMDAITHRRGVNRGVMPAWLGGNGTIKQAESPVESVSQIFIRVLSDGNEHTFSELRNEIVVAGYQKQSCGTILTKLFKDNVIIRVSRGVYKLADKATIVPITVMKEAK